MEHVISVIFLIIIILFPCFYLYKCVFNRVREGWIFNIKTFGRWSRNISGIRDFVTDKDGNRIPGKNTKKFFFIFWGFQTISVYKLNWGEGKEASAVTKEDTVMWKADPQTGLVTVQRSEWTNHHKGEFLYRFRINGLETGKLPDTKNVDIVENIKVDTLIASNVIMINSYQAENQKGGEAHWYDTLLGILQGTLGEVLCSTTYANLGELRGIKFQNILVSNIEPGARKPKTNGPDDKGYVPEFKDADGSRREKITILERVNYELVYQQVGIQLSSLMILDFEVDAKYQGFLDAMQEQAISEIKKAIAQNNAEALAALLRVENEALETFMNNLAKAANNVKKTEDVTAIKVAEWHKNVTMMVNQGSEAGDGKNPFENVNVNEMLNVAFGSEMARKFQQSIEKQSKGGDNS